MCFVPRTAVFEQGRVFLPEKGPWLDGFYIEFLVFPSGRHDGQVDSMSQFLKWS
jgi:predicted phage terminase large subunit-like protein